MYSTYGSRRDCDRKVVGFY